jgi:geranylgeranyl pyrophosphate synthase
MTREVKVPKEVIEFTRKVANKLDNFGIDEFVNAELASPSVYLLKNKGKLLRPTLLCLGAYYTGIKNPLDYVGLGTAVELLHTSSLIHDDLIDKDLIRRGKDTVHLKYGIEKAILAGDALISRAINEASVYGTKVVNQISDAAMKMCAGEIVDYKYRIEEKIPSLSEYIRIAELKSAALIAVSASIVAFHKSDRDAKRLYEFGMNLGTGFQIRDDIIDFIGLQCTRGIEGGSAVNIVNCIKEKFGEDAGSAVNMAIDLNRKSVMKAIMLFKGREKGSLLREYAKKVLFNV